MRSLYESALAAESRDAEWADEQEALVLEKVVALGGFNTSVACGSSMCILETSYPEPTRGDNLPRALTAPSDEDIVTQSSCTMHKHVNQDDWLWMVCFRPGADVVVYAPDLDRIDALRDEQEGNVSPE